MHCLLLVMHTVQSVFISFWPRDYSDAFLLQFENLVAPRVRSLKNRLLMNFIDFEGNTGLTVNILQYYILGYPVELYFWKLRTNHCSLNKQIITKC